MRQRFAAVDQQHVEPRLRQDVRNNAATGACANDDRVVLGTYFIDASGAQRCGLDIAEADASAQDRSRPSATTSRRHRIRVVALRHDRDAVRTSDYSAPATAWDGSSASSRCTSRVAARPAGCRNRVRRVRRFPRTAARSTPRRSRSNCVRERRNPPPRPTDRHRAESAYRRVRASRAIDGLLGSSVARASVALQQRRCGDSDEPADRQRPNVVRQIMRAAQLLRDAERNTETDRGTQRGPPPARRKAPAEEIRPTSAYPEPAWPDGKHRPDRPCSSTSRHVDRYGHLAAVAIHRPRAVHDASCLSAPQPAA